MKCKYKKFSNERFCQAVWGECQFLECKYGPECPIYNAFRDWDAYCLEKGAEAGGGTARVEGMATADADDPAQGGPSYVDVINIEIA